MRSISSSVSRGRVWQGRYVDTWRAQDARYFNVNGKPAHIPFGELSVTVDPEVGMRTSAADRAFKLWFSKQEVSNLLDVCNYLLQTETLPIRAIL